MATLRQEISELRAIISSMETPPVGENSPGNIIIETISVSSVENNPPDNSNSHGQFINFNFHWHILMSNCHP